MKFNLLFVLIFITSDLFSQKDMSIDIIGSFDFSNQVDNRSGFSSTDFGTAGIYTYRAGFNFNFRLFEKIMCKTGLRFSQIGDNTYRNNLRWPSEITSNGWEPDPSLPRYLHNIIKHRYIEIPLVFRYEYKNKKKFQTFIEGGFSANIYINTKNISKSNISSPSEVMDLSDNEGFNSRQFALLFSVGTNYDISDEYQVFAQPIIRYHTNELSSNPSAQSVRYYSMGVEFGVRYRFGSYFLSEER